MTRTTWTPLLTAETLAAERESALLALTESVDVAVPRLRAAAAAVDQTERAARRTDRRTSVLTSVRVPAGVSELDSAVTAQQQALQRRWRPSGRRRPRMRRPGTPSPAAPDRGPLEQARREHAEQRRILAEVPAARTDVEAAATRLEQAGQHAEAAAGEASRRAVVPGTPLLRSRRGCQLAPSPGSSPRAKAFAAVTLPAGWTELDRSHPRRRAVRCRSPRSSWQPPKAPMPPPGPPFAAPRARGAVGAWRCGSMAELAVATAGLGPMVENAHSWPAKDLERTRRTTSSRRRPPATRPAPPGTRLPSPTGRRHCGRTSLPATPARSANRLVTTLPPPAHAAAKSTAAEKAVATAEAKVEQARAEDLKVAQLVAAIDAQLAAATNGSPPLQAALDGQPTGRGRDPGGAETALTGLSRPRGRRRGVRGRALSIASRAGGGAAGGGGCSGPAPVAAAVVRDPLVALGAPAVDGSDLLASWTLLTEWAADSVGCRRQALPGAHAADDAAQAAFASAEKALADAQPAPHRPGKRRPRPPVARAGQGRD